MCVCVCVCVCKRSVCESVAMWRRKYIFTMIYKRIQLTIFHQQAKTEMGAQTCPNKQYFLFNL